MNAETVRVNLRYEQTDLESILRYARSDDVRRNGRYDVEWPLVLNIWTHTWTNQACKAESTLMFSVEFDWNALSLMSVTLQPGFDWEALLDELGRLERAALGDVVYGRSRCEPKT